MVKSLLLKNVAMTFSASLNTGVTSECLRSPVLSLVTQQGTVSDWSVQVNSLDRPNVITMSFLSLCVILGLRRDVSRRPSLSKSDSDSHPAYF